MKITFALVLMVLILGVFAADDETTTTVKTTTTTTVKPTTTTTVKPTTTTTVKTTTSSTVKPVSPSTTPKPPTTTTPAPEPDDDQKKYIYSFMSFGINITNDNLFDYSNKTQKLTPIFDHTKTNDIKLTHSIWNMDISNLPITTALYFHQPDLNPLLNATVAVLQPGNYSYQLHHSTYYGRVSGETIGHLPLWSAKRIHTKKEFLSKDFIEDTGNLATDKSYDTFLAKYGTHYFTEADFGGIFRMQVHVTNKYVRDVSEEGFKGYMLQGLARAFLPVSDVPLSYDFFYHNHYDNFTYGGDKTLNGSIQKEALKWALEIYKNEIVPTNLTFVKISDLIKETKIISEDKLGPVIEGLTKATQNELNKFKVKSYMEAMDVVLKNPYGKALGGAFDAQFLYSYFEGKLKEAEVNLDEEFYDNAWAAEHNAQAILNRRAWFEKPYPPEPTTLAPTTEPTKPANATEAATTVATTKKA